MVFANISQAEKEAFFALLDEYFESRPQNATTHKGSNAGALSESIGPTGAAALNKLSSTGSSLRSTFNSHIAQHPPTPGTTASPKGNDVHENSGSAAAENPNFSQLRNTFAQAQSASSLMTSAKAKFGGLSNKAPPPPAPRPRVGTPSSATSADPPHSPPLLNAPPPPPAPAPPPAPRRAPSTASNTSTTGGVSSLKSASKFGNVDVDVSSKSTAMSSITSKLGDRVSSALNRTPSANSRSSFSPPPALVQQKHTFAPPPVRRLPSADAPPPVAKKPRTPTPEPVEEEAQGEWAEALYDYMSDDKGDLSFSANQRILVTNRTSSDWWTGEVEGKEGLFPASYVKVL